MILNLQVQVLLLSRRTSQYHTRELVVLQGQSRELRSELIVAWIETGACTEEN